MSRLANGFRYAWTGCKLLLRTQRHARVHAVATFAVTALAAWLKVDPIGWALLALATGLVWMAEALNTAIELLADRVCREHDTLIGQAKDVAAAGVLLASLCAVIVGAIVLGPPLASIFRPI